MVLKIRPKPNCDLINITRALNHRNQSFAACIIIISLSVQAQHTLKNGSLSRKCDLSAENRFWGPSVEIVGDNRGPEDIRMQCVYNFARLFAYEKVVVKMGVAHINTEGNGPCHKSMATMVKLNELRLELLPQPANSLNSAPSDYWLFADLKKILQGN